MKRNKKITFISSLSILAMSAGSSQALVVILSDLTPAGSPLENFINDSFSNVTEIRHGNYANFAAVETQDALNGTGAFAGSGAADVVIIGRSLSSGDYDAGDSTGYNSLSIPMVSLTSYTVRSDGTRLGWHGLGATTDKSVAGAETTLTSAAASILGVPTGTYDLVMEVSATDSTFNGLGSAGGSFGGADILATIGGDVLAAYWAPGSAPGDPTAAGVATFSGPRLLFNLDNDVNTGNNGANDLNNLTSLGRLGLIGAIDYATPLTAVPEPSTSFLGLAALALAGLRRRR